MEDIPQAWLQSGESAHIFNLKLRPLEFPVSFLKGTLMSTVGGQAEAFYLTDENNLGWVLKKFLPWKMPGLDYINALKELIPYRKGFESGHLRRVVTKAEVGSDGFFTPGFPEWIENTVLMPRIPFNDWCGLADKIRSGRVTLPDDERLALCRFLSEEILSLEVHSVSHRDLSSRHVLLDDNNQVVHLIGWDAMFHPSLSWQPNTTAGTCGYLTPLALSINSTWKPHADRFSLAVLNAEFLSMSPGSSMTHDGGLFDQGELFNRGGPGISAILHKLEKDFPGAEVLFGRALDARTFDECPTPVEWMAFSSGGSPLMSSAAEIPPLQFYSCFISYNHRDQDFAQRLYSRLRDASLRVWFAPENAEPGKKMKTQVDEAIQMHDRLLLVLSDNSLHSNWVEREIRKAREFERRGGRQKLFPIRLTDYETLANWECIDSVTAEDLAEEVRSYFIPDFSNWKNYDDFERAFARLLDALKQSERTP